MPCDLSFRQVKHHLKPESGHAGAGRERSASSAHIEPDLVFITGASRSGTTVLSRALGNHSKILALNELHFFGDLCGPSTGFRPLPEPALARLAADLLARQTHGLWRAGRGALDDERVRPICASLDAGRNTACDVFGAVCASVTAEAGKSIACEQTPRNIFYAQAILKAFPLARIVHLVRDPRAVAASQKNRWQLRRLGAKNVPRAELIRTWINYHPVTMAKLWKHATLAAMNLDGHPRVKVVRFENLAMEPEHVLSQLCDFLDLEFEDAMLDVPVWGSSNVRHEESGSGISSEVVDKWKTILDAGEVDLVERVTGEEMGHFEYQRVNRRTPLTRILSLRHLIAYPLHLAGVALANPRRAWIQLSAMFRPQEADARD